jgi:hypothetical protein
VRSGRIVRQDHGRVLEHACDQCEHEVAWKRKVPHRMVKFSLAYHDVISGRCTG